MLSRVKLLCVLLKCQSEVRWSGPTQASSHASVTDSPSLSSSPQVMLVHKRNAACSLRWKNWCETEEKCLNTVPWSTRFGSDRSQYSRGETKSQMHGANTRRESCIAISCVMTTASRECAQWACTEDREPELLTRSCRTLHPDVVHLLRNAFSCEAPDAPSRKLESRR